MVKSQLMYKVENSWFYNCSDSKRILQGFKILQESEEIVERRILKPAIIVKLVLQRNSHMNSRKKII
jgi:hypothetical protein